VHIWEYVSSINKLKASPIEMGKLVRNFNSLSISSDDAYLFAGSQSGDLLQVNLHRNVLKSTGPAKALPGGITASCNVPENDCVLFGTGTGVLGAMSCPEQVSTAPSQAQLHEVVHWVGLRVSNSGSYCVACDLVVLGSSGHRTAVGCLKRHDAVMDSADNASVQDHNARQAKHMSVLIRAKVEGRVTSISIDHSSAQAHTFIAYVGTDACNIYQALVDLRSKQITPQLVQSAHAGSISSVAFPEQYGEVRPWALIPVLSHACNCSNSANLQH
jgi:hypothetical protein